MRGVLYSACFLKLTFMCAGSETSPSDTEGSGRCWGGGVPGSGGLPGQGQPPADSRASHLCCSGGCVCSSLCATAQAPSPIHLHRLGQPREVNHPAEWHSCASVQPGAR